MLRLRQPHPPTSIGLTTAAADQPDTSPIIRDFADPYLELVRLLDAAAEIEHALLIQYLYGAFSLKPAYANVKGDGSFGGSTDLLGVAVQEMEHLQTVNSLLVDLHAAPNLLSQNMPYEAAIYPFVLHTERLSRASVAKYVFTEARAGVLDPDDPANAADLEFIHLLEETLGQARPNHIGSLYETIIKLIDELMATGATGLPDLAEARTNLESIREEGENGHFPFFKQVFMGDDRLFGTQGVWDLPDDHADYPSLPVPTDPSAYESHPNEIGDDNVRQLAFLANLQYWIVLMLLDLSYRQPDGGRFLTMARKHMIGPLKALGNHLPTVGAAVPFDALGIAYSPGIDRAGCLGVVRHLLGESQKHTAALSANLPMTYPRSVDGNTLQQLGT